VGYVQGDEPLMSTGKCATGVLRYAWAAPCSLVGLLLTLVALLSGATARFDGGSLEVAGGRFGPRISRLPRGLRFSAITFGHVILGVSHASLAIHRAHEHVHVRQYERWGILFFPLYCGSSLVQLLRGCNPYLDNRFEREARCAVAAAAEKARLRLGGIS
jgi:hypothetical protein